MTSTVRPALILLLTLLVASCGEAPAPLDAKEVLKRSIIRSSAIDSASVSASAFLLLKGYSSFSGSAVLQGVIRGTGGWSADLSFQGRDASGSGPAESGRVKAVSVDGSLMYLKPESLQGPLLELYAKTLTGSQNGWWSAGQPATIPQGGRHTLSPAELNQTASLFSIVSSSGPEKLSGRQSVYRIAVSLSPDAVTTLFANSAKENTRVSGVLWIDARDFTLVRAVWNLSDVFTVLGPADLSVDVTLSEINRAPEIVPPTGSSGLLPLNGVFATISH